MSGDGVVSEFRAPDQDGPSPEELTIDDSLSDLAKFERYVKSDIVLHRLFMLKELEDVTKHIGFEATKEHVIPALDELSSDVEAVIRQTMVEQLPLLARFLVSEGGEAGYQEVIRVFVPLLGDHVVDKSPQVRGAAGTSLVEVSRLFKQADLEEHVVTLLRKIATDGGEEEHRIEACKLVDDISAVLGKEIVKARVVPIIAELAADPMFRVRKACAGNMATICEVLGAETGDTVFPVYKKLTDDEIWGVRKACAESLVVISKHIDRSLRSGQLMEIFESFVQDVSRWVRGAAFQALGPFIATFSKDDVSPALLKYYNDMANPANAKAIDSEIASHCAFNFPAVLQTVGREKWDQLQQTFETLVRDMQWKVRRSLSHSLHEVALLLGPELTEGHLVPTFELFLKDLDEVKIGVIRGIAKFLGVLSPGTREKYLGALREIQNESDNWRFREYLAEQMEGLVDLFPAEAVNEHLVPLALELCHDSVACVRGVANSALGPIVNRLHPGEMREAFVVKVLQLCSGESYQERQMFIRICENLAARIDYAMFNAKFLPQLCKMRDDRVPNVRISLARALSTIRRGEHFNHSREIIETLNVLKGDRDRDVQAFAGATPSAT